MAKTRRRKKIRLPEVLDERELEDMLNAPSKSSVIGSRDRCLILVMGYCGLRVGEICGSDGRKTKAAPLPGLMVDDLHLDEARPYIRVVGKGNKQRIAWLSTWARDLLKAWLAVRPSGGRGQALFPVIRSGRRGLGISKPGRSVSTEAVRKMVKRCARKVGIERRVFPHILRHTCASMMLRKPGANLEMVRKMLGHEDARTTMIYVHVSDNQMAQFAEQMVPKGVRPVLEASGSEAAVNI